MFISVFSGTEAVGTHRREIGVVQTPTEKQIFTDTIAAASNCNTWHKYSKHSKEGGITKRNVFF